MPIITTTIAVGYWSDRQNLDYIPVNDRLPNGLRYDAQGFPVGNRNDGKSTIDYGNARRAERRPYRIDDGGSVVYICYDSDADADIPIYRIEEE